MASDRTVPAWFTLRGQAYCWCRGNSVSSASYGFLLDRCGKGECSDMLTEFRNNTAHSNEVAGILITGLACNSRTLPSIRLSNNSIYKHCSSGLVLDGLESAEIDGMRLIDNQRQESHLPSEACTSNTPLYYQSRFASRGWGQSTWVIPGIKLIEILQYVLYKSQ